MIVHAVDGGASTAGFEPSFPPFTGRKHPPLGPYLRHAIRGSTVCVDAPSRQGEQDT